MKIRPATPEDIPHILDMEREATTAAHWGEGQYTSLFDAHSLRRIVLVAEVADQDLVLKSALDRLCGFIVARATGTEWEIENVVVRERVRRGGIGSRLLHALLEQGRKEGCETVLLEVRESNLAARKLYEKKGFRNVGTRRAYYGNPTEDAVLLSFDFRRATLENA